MGQSSTRLTSTRSGSLLDQQYTGDGQPLCTVGCPQIANDIRLNGNSHGEVEGVLNKFEADFEEECATRTKLQYPNIVSGQGVHLERASHSPVLVMKKMETSLHTFLGDHSKEFPLHLKASLLRQLAQAFAKLHNPNPTAYVLNPKRVLLMYLSAVRSIHRAITSTPSQRLSIEESVQFMPPEAFESLPWYNEKLDVFSFGNVMISTLIDRKLYHPGCLSGCKKDIFVAVTELPFHKDELESFAAQQEQQFLPTECCQKKSLYIVLGDMKFAVISLPLHEMLRCQNMDLLTTIFNNEYLQQIAVIERQKQNWAVLDATEIEISIARSLGNFPAAHTIHVPHTVRMLHNCIVTLASSSSVNYKYI